MWYRRALFTVQFAATIILPLWLLIGRVFFGVILGWHYAIQLYLAPLLFLFLAVVSTLSWARRSSRSIGAVTHADAWLLSLWYLAIVVYGFTVVDSVHSDEQGRSIATVLFGQQWRDASFTIADIAGGVVIVAALATFWVVLVEYLVETRPMVVKALTGLDDGELREIADAPAAALPEIAVASPAVSAAIAAAPAALPEIAPAASELTASPGTELTA